VSPEPVVRRPQRVSRPGVGQSRGRAPRGWHPDDIVAGYLVPDERVVLEETRSVRGFLVGQLVWIVLGVVVSALLLSAMGAVVAPLVVIGLFALGAVIGVRALQAWFTRYVVTDLRVLRVHGILNRHAEFIPWGKVTDITRSETIVQWVARTATICIESANEKSGLRTVDDVDDPDYFYRVLVEMIDRKQGRISDVTPPRRG
jgi:uncharacterized membrane protein YdbT with pleckstrin-like domain